MSPAIIDDGDLLTERASDRLSIMPLLRIKLARSAYSLGVITPFFQIS